MPPPKLPNFAAGEGPHVPKLIVDFMESCHEALPAQFKGLEEEELRRNNMRCLEQTRNKI
uniref:Uncharacterized protein n=1 Tax=Karlodinium veneficum TaxID=407301 RepID=A7WPW1_KARVE|nr:unknown [Karlodinium veneficum]